MATEKRLIDANTLSEELSTLTMTITGLRAGKGVLREFMAEYRNSVLRIVDEQPTVAAVEVVHGRWVMPTIINGRSFKIPHCSVCNEVPCGVSEDTKYCAICGARMDLENTKNG